MRFLGLLFFAAALCAVAFAVQLPSSASAADLDCADFSSQAEAQENLLPGDPYGLDGDSDGTACEDNPCPCAGESAAPPPPAAPPKPPPYRLSKPASRAAAKQLARRFVQRNPAVDSLAFAGCSRLGTQRVECRLTASGSTPEQQTTCHLRISVGARNRHPDPRLVSSPCRTVRTLKLAATAARTALRSRGAELAGKAVGIFNLERTSATTVRGLAEWSQATRPTGREECFALMEAVLAAPEDLSVEVIETDCQAGPAL
jgi:hypothetical protein